MHEVVRNLLPMGRLITGRACRRIATGRRGRGAGGADPHTSLSQQRPSSLVSAQWGDSANLEQVMGFRMHLSSYRPNEI